MKRSVFDIYADLLILARGSCKKTRLMYRANLSWACLEDKLKVLLGTGLLECADRLYTTTEKGKRYLGAYDTLISLCEVNKVA